MPVPSGLRRLAVAAQRASSQGSSERSSPPIAASAKGMSKMVARVSHVYKHCPQGGRLLCAARAGDGDGGRRMFTTALRAETRLAGLFCDALVVDGSCDGRSWEASLHQSRAVGASQRESSLASHLDQNKSRSTKSGSNSRTTAVLRVSEHGREPREILHSGIEHARQASETAHRRSSSER